MLTTSEGEFDTKNVTRNIVDKVKIYFKKYIISVNVCVYFDVSPPKPLAGMCSFPIYWGFLM